MLTVKNLVKHYPLKAGRFSSSLEKIHALNGVSFTLGSRQTLGIVGESGCGKSTLAKAILGIKPPDSGQIILDPPDTRMQYIFQDPYLSLNPKMQVKDIITEPMRAADMITRHDVPREAERLLELVGLPKVGGMSAVLLLRSMFMLSPTPPKMVSSEVGLPNSPALGASNSYSNADAGREKAVIKVQTASSIESFFFTYSYPRFLF